MERVTILAVRIDCIGLIVIQRNKDVWSTFLRVWLVNLLQGTQFTIVLAPLSTLQA
jgi:hypothetical protein